MSQELGFWIALIAGLLFIAVLKVLFTDARDSIESDFYNDSDEGGLW